MEFLSLKSLLSVALLSGPNKIFGFLGEVCYPKVMLHRLIFVFSLVSIASSSFPSSAAIEEQTPTKDLPARVEVKRYPSKYPPPSQKGKQVFIPIYEAPKKKPSLIFDLESKNVPKEVFSPLKELEQLIREEPRPKIASSKSQAFRAYFAPEKREPAKEYGSRSYGSKENKSETQPAPAPEREPATVVEVYSRIPTLDLMFGSGWTYGEGDSDVPNLNISFLSRVYAEFLVRWWGAFWFFGPDLGMEAYYWTPSLYSTKCPTCQSYGTNNARDVSINIHKITASLLYRFVFPSIQLTPEVGYVWYLFDIPTSPTLIIVDHDFQGVSMGGRINASLATWFPSVSLFGITRVALGDYDERGRVLSIGREKSATMLHGEVGLRYDWGSRVYTDAVWHNETFWYHFNSGNARSSYWNVGLRIEVDLPI